MAPCSEKIASNPRSASYYCGTRGANKLIALAEHPTCALGGVFETAALRRAAFEYNVPPKVLCCRPNDSKRTTNSDADARELSNSSLQLE